MPNANELKEKIKFLAKEKNAAIFAHTYQSEDIQEIADVVADSLELAKRSKSTNADIIILCGVYFMAESAKILSPKKKVIIPRPDAGCPMADMANEDGVMKMKETFPNAKVVTYVNSTATIKAISDVCVTSANALEVVRNMPDEEIIFLPDKHLGTWISEMLPQKKIHLYPGFCPVHQKFSISAIEGLQEDYPNAITLCHPEADKSIRTLSDKTMSTSQMINYAKESEENEFIILTETGISYPLEKACPQKKFFYPNKDAVCVNMKKTTLNDVYIAVDEERYEVEVEESVREKALKALEAMLEYSGK